MNKPIAMKFPKPVLIALITLGTAAIIFSAWGIEDEQTKKLRSENLVLTTLNDSLANELTEFTEFKNYLEAELDSMTDEYLNTVEMNEDLQCQLSDANEMIRRKDNLIQKLKTGKENDILSLKSELRNLYNLRFELEHSLEELKTENDSLQMRADSLNLGLLDALAENEKLTASNNKMKKNWSPPIATFKAQNFRIDIEGKRDKLTAKSRKARNIDISFELGKVHKNFEGYHPIYLVILDDNKNPISSKKPVHREVKVRGKNKDIVALKEEYNHIKTAAKISLKHKLENKLKPGIYTVDVYTKFAHLGRSQFRID